MALDELRPAWRDHTCSALGPMDSANMERLFVAVRQANAALPKERRIRVLAGDPPIDWAKVRTRDELQKWLEQRDKSYAEIVEREVLAKGRRALLIIGGAHLERGPLPPGTEGGMMLERLERQYPGQTFVVVPHEGFRDQNDALEPRLATWPRPALALLAGTWLGDVPAGGAVEDVMIGPDGQVAAPPRDTLADKADAYLYLGPIESLTMEARSPELFRDRAYVDELDRRHKLASGRPLDREKLLRPRPKKWADNFRWPPAGEQIDIIQGGPPGRGGKVVIPFGAKKGN
jgi:hypothetical protein